MPEYMGRNMAMGNVAKVIASLTAAGKRGRRRALTSLAPLLLLLLVALRYSVSLPEKLVEERILLMTI
jgi:hypothetical protein